MLVQNAKKMMPYFFTLGARKIILRCAQIRRQRGLADTSVHSDRRWIPCDSCREVSVD